jgi:hypothetical protein
MRRDLTCSACDAPVIWPTDLRDSEMHCPRCHATIPRPAAIIQEEPASLDPESATSKISFPETSHGWFLPDWFYGWIVAAPFIVLILVIIMYVYLWINGGLGNWNLGRIG